jgi:hypothetical protein
MGVSTEKIEEATKGAIGLSKSLGIDTTAAMKAMALALNGDYNMLSRYNAEIRMATTETEKAAIVQKLITKGWNQATAETGTLSGKISQMNNAIDDMKESIGAVIVPALLPLVNIIKEAAVIFGNLPGPIKAMGVAMVVAFAAAITAAKLFGTTLTIATGGISLAVGLLVGLAAWIVSNWDTVKTFVTDVWMKIKNAAILAFDHIKLYALMVVQALLDVFNMFFIFMFAEIDLVIKAYNALTGKHVATLTEMKNNLKTSIDEKIVEYQREIEEIKRINAEAEKEHEKTLKNKKAADDKDKKLRKTEKLKEETQEAKEKKLADEKLAKEKLLKEAQEKKAMNEMYEVRKYYAEAGVRATYDALMDEKATVGKVLGAIIRAQARAIAERLLMMAVAELAMLNFIGAATLTAAAAGVAATGTKIGSLLEGNAFAEGGVIDEPVVGVGLRSGERYTLGEAGPEMVTPMRTVNNDYGVAIYGNITVRANDPREFMAALKDYARRTGGGFFRR